MNRLVARWAIRQAIRVAKTFDKALVNRWRKDLRVLTKIYKDLDVDIGYGVEESRAKEAVAAWEHARKIFRTFRDNIEEATYKELLPKVTSDHPESYMEKLIRKSVWELRYQLDDATLFPGHGSGAAREPDWSKLRHERDRTIKRYQKAAVAAFKEIDDYLDTKPEGKLERLPAVQNMEVGGAHVIILNFGRTLEGNDQELDFYLEKLRDKIDLVKHAGFAEAVKGLTITIDFDQKEWDTNGDYNASQDRLRIFPMGLVAESGTGEHGTFAHECGHRFYFKNLSSSARQRWETVMAERGVKITAEDIQRFAAPIIRQLKGHESEPEHLLKLIGDDDRMRAVKSITKDESDEAKFRELSKLPLKPWASETFDPEAYVKLLSSREGEFAQIEEITDYANTSPIEAFAEVFRLWVKKGPRAVGPWTQEFFRETCRSGGAKLAADSTSARTAERYLVAQEIYADYVRAGVADCVDEHVDAQPWLDQLRAQVIASRYLEGKAKGLVLVPEYKKALADLEKGDTKAMDAFAQKVRDLIAGRPDWLSALSTQKMNAVKALYRGVQEYQLYASSIQTPILKDRIIQDAAGWAKSVRTLELASAIGDEDLEIKHGPFTVVPIPGVPAIKTEDALKALDAAVAKIQPKCPKVLYGKVFLATHLKKGVAAWYDEGHDTLALNVDCKNRFSDVHSIIHELGHRHDKKGFLSNKGRIEYWKLSTQKVHEFITFDAKLREQVADEMVGYAKLKAAGQNMPTEMSEMLATWLKYIDAKPLLRDFLSGKIDEKKLHEGIKGKRDEIAMTGKVISEPLYVTPYGKTGGPKENYADGFAHFILGMDMPAPLAAILAEELK